MIAGEARADFLPASRPSSRLDAAQAAADFPRLPPILLPSSREPSRPSTPATTLPYPAPGTEPGTLLLPGTPDAWQSASGGDSMASLAPSLEERFDATAHGVGVALARFERPRLSQTLGAVQRSTSTDAVPIVRCNVGGAVGEEPSASKAPGRSAPLPSPPSMPRGNSCLATRLSLAAGGSNPTAGAKAVLGAVAAGGRRASLLEVASMMQRMALRIKAIDLVLFNPKPLPKPITKL